MDIKLAQFNDSDYFLQLKDKYEIKVNPREYDDEVSKSIKGWSKVWIANNPKSLYSSLIEKKIEIIGLRISMGACDNGIYAVQSAKFSINGQVFQGYQPRIEGVWFATAKNEAAYPGYKYYPIFFDPEYAQESKLSQLKKSTILHWCRG